jgi:4-amino-4-deoxy-L-arabinose transferase-like glycosyltransferase
MDPPRFPGSAFAYLSLIITTLLCLLPFSGRAFHTDDTLFVWAAQQISKHPLDPYGFNLNWGRTEERMSEVTQNPPLACYYIAAVAQFVGWSERALHLAFLLPTLALVLGVYRLANRFTRFAWLAALATLLTPALLVSACSTMCDPMMLSLWLWAIIFWMEGLDSGKPLWLSASALLITASELTKYFGGALILLLFAYSFFRQRRVGSWAWYLLIPISAMIGYEYLSAKMYGHGLLRTAAKFSEMSRLGYHASKGGKVLIGLSYGGGSALLGLLFAPIIWSRKQIVMATLASGTAVFFIMHGWVRLGVGADGHAARMARHAHWGIISSHLVLFIAGGISVLALAIADYINERNANSLLLLLWVVGTFWFTAFLNWTMNARSILPMVPAVAILVARRLETLSEKRARALMFSVASALLISGIASLWLASADSELANSARTAAFLIREKTSGGGDLWYLGHSGFQYYMQALGARCYDWKHPQTKKGDYVAIFQVWPSYGMLNFDGAREDFLVPIHSHASTLAPDRGAGFYYSYWFVMPYIFDRVHPEKYVVVQLDK